MSRKGRSERFKSQKFCDPAVCDCCLYVGDVDNDCPFEGDTSVVLVCNDKSKVMNLPANRGLREEDGRIVCLPLEVDL